MSTELIDVRMPDGTIVSGVPKDISQSEVIRRYSLSQRPPAGAPNFVPQGLQPDKNAAPSAMTGPLSFTDQHALADMVSGVSPGTQLERLGGVGAWLANKFFPAGDTKRPNTEEPLTPEQQIGQKIVTVGALAPVATGLASAARAKFLPSADAAGQKFEQVMAAAKDVPINTADAQLALEKAQHIEKYGGQALPKPLADFSGLTKPGTVTIGKSPVPVAIEPPPLTYQGGRQLASNTGDLLGSGELKPQMKYAVGEFYDAMKSANREAAAKVGLGDVYDSAMKEYRQAKTIQQGVDILKKWGVAAALTLGGGSIALKAGKELLGF